MSTVQDLGLIGDKTQECKQPQPWDDFTVAWDNVGSTQKWKYMAQYCVPKTCDQLPQCIDNYSKADEKALPFIHNLDVCNSANMRFLVNKHPFTDSDVSKYKECSPDRCKPCVPPQCAIDDCIAFQFKQH